MTNSLTDLKVLIPFLDEILSVFYRELLSHKHMAVFFDDDAHIKLLIEKQKQNFIDSLDDDEAEFESRYMALGRIHYDLRVPNVDFLKGTDILRAAFTDIAITKLSDVSLLKKIDRFFRDADIYMSKGYLDKQLAVDKEDILDIIGQYEDTGLPGVGAGLSHLAWLYELLLAIEARDIAIAPELDVNNCSVHQVLTEASSKNPLPISLEHFKDLHHRIHIDANNLFYFIEKNDYPEVLALYSTLFGVYKITLIFMSNHALQVALNKSQSELKESRAILDTVTEMLPICSYCHNIRNDAGSWTRLEEFLQSHADIRFSHSVCNNCLKKLERQIPDDGGS